MHIDNFFPVINVSCRCFYFLTGFNRDALWHLFSLTFLKPSFLLRLNTRNLEIKILVSIVFFHNA